MNTNKPLRNVIGPLVKAQSLYLRSEAAGTKHWDFQTNINALIKCNNDEIMRVSLSSVNIFNSYQQVTDENNTIILTRIYAGYPLSSEHKVPVGTYTMALLADALTESLQSQYGPGVRASYNAETNRFTLSANEAFTLRFTGNMNMILGFSQTSLPEKVSHSSDRAPLPHGVAEIVVELFGLTPIEGAAPISNYESATDDVDFGHVLAVVPAGPVWERTIFNNNSPEFNSYFFSEHTVNTLRIAMVDRQGRPHTWIAHPVGISLLFETFKRA